MGRGRGGRGRGRGKGRGGASGAGDRPAAKDRYDDVSLSNESFEAYYKAQQIVPAEEWDALLAAFRDPLPTTFRITGCRPIAGPLNEMIKSVFVPYLSGLMHEGVPLSPPKSLDWYPEGYAWQLNIAKTHIRKNDAFKRFQHFLVYETDAGNISRQEAVSMIPPLLLDILPHHYVLDVCAAPGSKSVQLLEALHKLPAEPSDSLSTIPPGLLIANDSDAKRCHMLVHQSLHRIPAAGMMVTNHDATQLPGLRLPGDLEQTPGGQEPAAKEEGEKKQKWKPLLFDRILADVPCSGDGTLRKNMGIWKDWTPGNGIGLHSLQLRILLRAITLLKPGGRLVYSTCSLNPTENEAVVSAALEACPEMSLLAVPELLPSLIRRPGLTTWQVLDNTMTEAPHPSLGPSSRGTLDKKGQMKIWAPTLWPNGKEEERGMDRCLRIYPHLQDTGGFFVSVLIKAEAEAEVTEVVEEVVASEPTKRTADERASSPTTGEPEAKRVRADVAVAADADAAITEAAPVEAESVEAVEEIDMSTLPAEVVGASVKLEKEFKEEPFTYLSAEDKEVALVLDFFDFNSSFPTSSLLVRNAAGAALRSIYFTSPLVRSLLISNSYNRMRLISCGVKVFSRQDSGKDGTYRCRWRVVSEGLEVLRPFMGPKRIVQASQETLKMLMMDMNIPFATLKEQAFKDRLMEMETGSCVLEVEATGKDIALSHKLILPLWRSQVSVNLMVEKVEKSALSLRLFGEDVTPHAPKAKTRARGTTREGDATPDTGAESEAVAVVEGEAAVECEATEKVEEVVAAVVEPVVE